MRWTIRAVASTAALPGTGFASSVSRFAGDPWMLPPDRAQAMLEKDFKDRAEDKRLAKLEPQG